MLNRAGVAMKRFDAFARRHRTRFLQARYGALVAATLALPATVQAGDLVTACTRLNICYCVNSDYRDAISATGDLLLSYPHSDVSRVRVTPGGTAPPLLLLLADDTAAAAFWQFTTGAGTVIVSGPELVRTATITGATLALTGDTTVAAPLEVWAPAQVTAVTWNGAAVATSKRPRAAWRRTPRWPGPPRSSCPP